LKTATPAAVKCSAISRHDSQSVLGCRGGDEEIRVTEDMAQFASGLDPEMPLKEDVLG
jgi:hypothetical protein